MIGSFVILGIIILITIIMGTNDTHDDSIDDNNLTGGLT